MLAFVIPLKPKQNSKNWRADSEYLQATLQSILHQSHEAYHVFVVLHDMPMHPLTHKKIDYIKLPFDYCPFECITDAKAAVQDSGYLTARDVEYLFDQGRKQMYGAALAKQMGFEYIMCLDADDLVSNNLVGFIKKNASVSRPGWFVDKGYYYLADQSVYVRQPYSMNTVCGSSHILYQKFIPDFNPGSKKLIDQNFFASHATLTRRVKEEYGKDLKPLPFYAIIYSVTNLNWSITAEKLKRKSLQSRFKFLIRRVWFCGRIRDTFSSVVIKKN